MLGFHCSIRTDCDLSSFYLHHEIVRVRMFNKDVYVRSSQRDMWPSLQFQDYIHCYSTFHV